MVSTRRRVQRDKGLKYAVGDKVEVSQSMMMRFYQDACLDGTVSLVKWKGWIRPSKQWMKQHGHEQTQFIEFFCVANRCFLVAFALLLLGGTRWGHRRWNSPRQGGRR